MPLREATEATHSGARRQQRSGSVTPRRRTDVQNERTMNGKHLQISAASSGTQQQELAKIASSHLLPKLIHSHSESEAELVAAASKADFLSGELVGLKSSPATNDTLIRIIYHFQPA